MINNYLKIYFKKNKISQYELAGKTGISRSKLNLSLNNKRKLTADELLKIAIVYDLDLNKIKKDQEIINHFSIKITTSNYPFKTKTSEF